MIIHLIIATESAEKIYRIVNGLIEKEENLQYISHKEEVYWKDHSMLDVQFEVDVTKALSQAEWIRLFDLHFKHNGVFKDDTFLEIDHYSEVGNRSDPFVIAYIPIKSVTE